MVLMASAKARHHVHWTKAVSVNIGGHKAGGGGTGDGRVGGKMHLEDISIGIINDIGTSKLLEAAVKETVFKKVEIHATAIYGERGEQVFLRIELENVQITSYQLGVLDNNAATDDLSLTLNFEKYKTTFTEYGKDGTKAGTWSLSGKSTRLIPFIHRLFSTFSGCENVVHIASSIRVFLRIDGLLDSATTHKALTQLFIAGPSESLNQHWRHANCHPTATSSALDTAQVAMLSWAEFSVWEDWDSTQT